MIWPHPGATAAADRFAADSSGFHFALGDLPTWLLAVFALLALLAATAAYVEQRKAGQVLASQVETQGDLLAEQRKATTALSDQAEVQHKALEDQQALNALQASVLEGTLGALARQQADQVSFELGVSYEFMPGESGAFHQVMVTNGSARPIRQVAAQLFTPLDEVNHRAEVIATQKEFRPTMSPVIGTGVMHVLDGHHEEDRLHLLRAEQTCALIFAVDTSLEAVATVRFTDDAGMHWEVEEDLHLAQLDSRDW
jgi:hypothetical protein